MRRGLTIAVARGEVTDDQLGGFKVLLWIDPSLARGSGVDTVPRPAVSGWNEKSVQSIRVGKQDVLSTLSTPEREERFRARIR